MRNMRNNLLRLPQWLWIIPAYFLAFELMNTSVSYFYSVLGTGSIRSVVEFTYRLRDITMILSALMVLFASRLTWDSVIVTILLWSVYYGTCWIYPQNVRYIEQLTPYFLYGNMVYIIVRARILSLKKFTGFCVAVSRFLVVAIAIGLFSVKNIGYYLSNNYMTFANALLFPLAFLILRISSKPKAVDVALLLFGIIMLLLFGSRGAFFVLVIQMVLTSWQKLKEMKKTPVAICVAVLTVIILAVLLLGSMDENLLLSGLDGFGRTIQKFFSGEFFKSKRNQLWAFLLSKSWEDALLGAGLGADRYYLPMRFTGVDASYAHNLLIEWIVDFGIIGGIGFFFLTKLLLRPLAVVKDKEEKAFYIMVFSGTYIFLMFSSSWITTAGFYILCALAVNVRRTGRISE